MRQLLWWSVVTLAMSCHSGEPFDLRGVPEDLGIASGESMTDTPALLPVADAGAGALDSGIASEAVAAPTPSMPPSPAPDHIQSSRPAELAPLGTACSSDAECSSAHCSTGRCCNRVCDDCEACSGEGRCEPLAECKFASCDDGLCRAARAPLGIACTEGAECESRSCVDGVCCESACDGVCQHCSAGGRCDVFPESDLACPELVCPPNTACRTYEPVAQRTCAGFGRCAGPDDCVVRNVASGVTCDAMGSRCDGHGTCQPDAPFPPFEPTQVCPGLEGGPLEFRMDVDLAAASATGGCWAGATYEVAAQYSFGSISVGLRGAGTITLGSYNFGFATSTKTQAFDAAGVLLPGCVVVDALADRVWEYATFAGETCRNAAFVRFTAHMSENGDL